jgi:hypothetical protein
MCCCGLGSQSANPSPAVQQSQPANEQPPVEKAAEMDVIFQYSPGKVVGKKVKANSPIPPGWVGGMHEVSAENLARENQIRAILANGKEGDTAQILFRK